MKVVSMVDNEEKEFSGAKIQILGTNPEHPIEGRVFVWTKMGWFERLEGPSGDVAFSHVADSQEELEEYIARDNPMAELQEIVGMYRKTVSEEFIGQSLSYSEPPGDSTEDPDEDDQEYHQHN